MKPFYLLIVIFFFILISCSNFLELDKYLNYYEYKRILESAKDGSVINIPEGVMILRASININSNITIKGAGIGKTVIISKLMDENSIGININGDDSLPNDKIRITGITFKQADQSENNKSTVIQITGTCKKFRIDNCNFENGGYYYGISIMGFTYGVIDHCQFIDASRENILVTDINPGDASWSRGISLGTDKAVYVEDCIFKYNTQGQQIVSANYGARYVFRHNVFSAKASLNAQPLDAHGNSIYGRGTVSVEIYENTFYSENSYKGMGIRGGTGVIYNNKFNGKFTVPINLQDYRSFNYKNSMWSAPYPSTYVPASPSAHPQPDQINNFYIWGNTYNGDSINDGYPSSYVLDMSSITGSTDYEKANIVSGRDYYESNPGYVPYTYPHPLTLNP
jgi:hypothetical protein